MLYKLITVDEWHAVPVDAVVGQVRLADDLPVDQAVARAVPAIGSPEQD